MAGNAFEYCHELYTFHTPARESWLVNYMGGNYRSAGTTLKCRYRETAEPEGLGGIGFRVCRNLP